MNELPTSGRFVHVNHLVPQLNPHIEQVANKYGCQYLDFFSKVVDEDDALRDDLTWDGLHLNDDGYALLARDLEPHLPKPG